MLLSQSLSNTLYDGLGGHSLSTNPSGKMHKLTAHINSIKLINYKNMPTTNYTTSDIYLASYLIYRGHSVSELQEIKPRKYVFVLDKPKTALDGDITDFYQCRASIEPMKYVTALKQLKSLVYNETNSRYPANQPVRS